MIIIGDATSELKEIAGILGISVKFESGLDTVKKGEPLWILPASYPEVHKFTSDELEKLNELTEGGSRILVEFDLPVLSSEITNRQCRFERLVIRQTDHPVTSDMNLLDLFEAHQAWFQSSDTLPEKTHELLSIARVSGFDKAVFGLPGKTFPALCCLPSVGNGSLLWSATSISSPSDRRYKPINRWRNLIGQILLYLNSMDTRNIDKEISITPDIISISTSNREKLYREAIDNNLKWYQNTEVLIEADGTKGVLEGLNSGIDIDGNQICMLHEGKPNERADCNIQSAFAFMAGGSILGNEQYAGIGKNLLNFTISDFQYKDKSVYSGLWRWFKTGYEKTVFYSDDNGWAGFLTLLYGAVSGDKAVLESGLRTAVSLKQTWGASGHRRRRIDLPDFYSLNGRQGLREESPGEDVYKSPHYEASAMAAMALASFITGDNSFTDVIKPGLDDYIKKWPDDIFFQHSENDDGSKFATALLFASEATGDVKYKNKAIEILQGFIDVQLKCGAIPDVDRPGERYGKNRSNGDYGTFESSIFQDSGDLVTDQVYGTSFMLMALYFAEIFSPGNESISKAKTGLADFLVQIQLKDTGRKILDGAWMRAFDPVRWEYYGASGDWAYGPYLMETGWCQAIIVLCLSWILGGEFNGSFSKSIKQTGCELLEQIEKEQHNIELNWKQNTPKAVKRVLHSDEPDVMI